MRRHAKASSAGSTQGHSPRLPIGGGLVLLISLVLGVAIASATAPTATIGTAASVTATSAQVSGTIDPQDHETTYRFEYSTDEATWQSGPSGGPLAAGSGSQVVSSELAGLAPNTTYFVRLAANNSDGSTTSAPPNLSFETERSAPDAQTLWAGTVKSDSATLAAKINPRNSAATYQFEWGADTGYGNLVPAGATPLGASDNDFHVVTAPISGLSPGTTYHFRVIGTNSETSQVDQGADHAFTTPSLGGQPGSCSNEKYRQGSGAGLPDCRAYEQVSPVEKNGYDVGGSVPPTNGTGFEFPASPVAASGDAAYFRAKGVLPGSPEGGESTSALTYLARRGGDGWSTGPAAPRLTKIGAYDLVATSVDLHKTVLRGVFDAFQPDPLPPEGESSTYLRQNLSGQTTRLFNDGASELQGAGSSDLGHFAFDSQAVLVDAPGVPAFGKKVYEYADGVIRLVSRQPGSGEPITDEAQLAGISAGVNFGGVIIASSSTGAGAVSADGSKIFFETPGSFGIPVFDSPLQVIYRRSEGSTQLASPSRRTPVDPQGPRPKYFMRATPDGNDVFFTSAELLTDDANTGASRKGADLYRYDFGADELVDISATPGGNGAEVQGVLGVSQDGKRVYYAALGQVVPGEGISGGPNVYLWEDDGSADGSTRFIATLDDEGDPFNDALVWATGASFPTFYSGSRVSPDGRFLLMQSKASLTGYPNQGCVQSGFPVLCTELFRYDAAAAGGAGELLCVSCNPNGDPPQGRSFIPVGTKAATPRTMSEDGREVFFTSQDSLLPRDTNGKADVYLWSEAGLSLLTSGQSSANSGLTGISADGSDAFFATRDRLVPRDADNNVDLYTAHVGGGFASQHEVPLPSCEGEACRGAGVPPPPPVAPLSASFSGAGNAKPKAIRCAKGKRRVKGRCVKRPSRKHHQRTAKQTGRASR